jgi:hypothetical protein
METRAGDRPSDYMDELPDTNLIESSGFNCDKSGVLSNVPQLSVYF